MASKKRIKFGLSAYQDKAFHDDIRPHAVADLERLVEP